MATSQLDRNLNSQNAEVASDLEEFDSLIAAYAENLHKTTQINGLQPLIINSFIDLLKRYLNLARTEFERLIEQEVEPSESSYVLHYKLPEVFKDLTLLHRDVLLELQIAEHKLSEGLTSEEKIAQHKEASQNALTEGVKTMHQKFRQETTLAERLKQRKHGITSAIKHFKNPWKAYEKQFETLCEHINAIAHYNKTVKQAIEVFQELRGHTESVVAKTLHHSRTITEDLQTSITIIESVENKEEISKVINGLEKTEQDLNITQQHQQEFIQSIAVKTENFTKINLPVGTQGGMLLEKPVDFGKSVKKWMDFNLLPMVIDLWEHQGDLLSFIKHSILNLKGSLSIAKGKDDLALPVIQIKSLKNIQRTTRKNVAQQKTLANAITNKLASDLLVTDVYGANDFLEVSLQTSLVQYSSDTNDRFSGVVNRIKALFQNVNSTYGKVASVNDSDLLEQATECIVHRMFKEENAQYDMLFLNKNFMGDLFIIAREKAEASFSNSLAQWNKGFNKSILVVGDDLSGKTTFIHKIAKQGLRKQTLFFYPQSTISFQGRKFNTTHDLEEALKEIKKTGYTAQPIIVIDAIEVWRSVSHQLLNSVRAVIKFIESESDQALVVVTTTKVMQRHLDRRLPFSKTFTTQIDLNQCSNGEIFNAVRLRHSASHQILIDKELEPISARQFKRLVDRLCNKLNNNIGEVLQAWTYGTTMTADNQIIYNEDLGHFPDFFTSEERLILKYILRYRTVNELTLKNFVGKRYSDGYESGLKRLLNTKVLLRNYEGNLHMNTVVINDVHEILTFRGIID